jgi:hypothetical protein
MPPVGFEPMIQVFERKMTFHALDRAAIVFGKFKYTITLFCHAKGLQFQT